MPASEQLSLHELWVAPTRVRDPKALTSPKTPRIQRKQRVTPPQQTTLQGLTPPLSVPPKTACPAISPAILRTAQTAKPTKYDFNCDPNFDPLEQCRLCGALLKHRGLDHSLCSSDCGWVVDLQWLAQMQRLKQGCTSVTRSNQVEMQAATHSKNSEGKTLTFLTYELSSTSKAAGGES